MEIYHIRITLEQTILQAFRLFHLFHFILLFITQNHKCYFQLKRDSLRKKKYYLFIFIFYAHVY